MVYSCYCYFFSKTSWPGLGTIAIQAQEASKHKSHPSTRAIQAQEPSKHKSHPSTRAIQDKRVWVRVRVRVRAKVRENVRVRLRLWVKRLG